MPYAWTGPHREACEGLDLEHAASFWARSGAHREAREGSCPETWTAAAPPDTPRLRRHAQAWDRRVHGRYCGGESSILYRGKAMGIDASTAGTAAATGTQPGVTQSAPVTEVQPVEPGSPIHSLTLPALVVLGLVAVDYEPQVVCGSHHGRPAACAHLCPSCQDLVRPCRILSKSHGRQGVGVDHACRRILLWNESLDQPTSERYGRQDSSTPPPALQ